MVNWRTFLAALAASAVLVLPARANAHTTLAGDHPLHTPGVLTVGLQWGYPPMEILTGPNLDQPHGVDITLAQQLAHRIGLRVNFVNYPGTNFDAILDGLNQGQWDIVMSSMTDTQNRERRAHFIRYMSVGQILLVNNGNPYNFSTLESLSGHRVGVGAGTLENDELTATNKKLAKDKLPLISIFAVSDDAMGVRSLALRRVDATFEDYPVAIFNVTLRPTVYSLAGQQLFPQPYGIALRRSDHTLYGRLTAALNSMRKDGTYMHILRSFNMQDAALSS